MKILLHENTPIYEELRVFLVLLRIQGPQMAGGEEEWYVSQNDSEQQSKTA